MMRKTGMTAAGLIVTATLVIVALLSCSPGTGIGLFGGSGGTTETTSFTSNGLNFEYDTDASTRTLLTMTDPSGESELTVWGDKDSTGQISAVTSVSGGAEGLSGFSALFANDVPYLIWLPGTEIDVTNNGDGTYTLEIAPRVGAAARTETTQMTFAAELFSRSRVVGDAMDNCHASLGCSSRAKRDLTLLFDLIYLQRVANYVFDHDCIEAEEQDADDCFELLALVDLLGDAMQGIVAGNSGLPADVRALCFDLSGNCDNGDEGGDGGGSTTPQVTISGGSTVCAGAASTYTAQLTGTSAQVLYYWSIVTGSGNISTSTGQSTSVTYPVAGTVQLGVEVRSTATGLAVATDSMTVTVSNTGSCASGLPTTCDEITLALNELADLYYAEQSGTPASDAAYCNFIEMRLHSLRSGCVDMSDNPYGTVEQLIDHWESEQQRVGCD